MAALETALAWQAAGHYVLPGLKGEKSSYVHYVRDGLDRPSADQVREWFSDPKAAEVLVVPGRATTPLLVVDVDVKADGTNGFDSMEAKGLEGVDRGAGQSSRSGNGEHHWYLADTTVGRNGSPGNVVEGVDVRSHNGLVSVGHYPEVVRPAEATDPAPAWAVKPYGGSADGATRGLDIMSTLKAYREPGKPSSEAQAAGGAILADGQGHEAVKGPLKRLVMAVLEGQPGALKVYKKARERWGSHPEADLEVSWDSHVRGVIAKALKATPMDPDYLPTRVERLKARAKAEADLEEFEDGLDDDPEGLTVEEREHDRKVAEERERRAIRREADRLDALEAGAGAPSILDAFMTLEDLGNMPESEPLVGTLVGRGQTAMIVAESNTGKTFLTVAMAHAVATGVPFAGHAVHQGRVLFVIGEDENGMKSRMEAVQTARGAIDVDMLDLVRVPFNLNDERAVEMVEEKVRTREYALIVLDPLARFIVDMDENDPTGMGVAMATLDRLRRANDQASIVVAHHTNKGGGYRGATSIYAAMDTVVGMKKGAGDAIALTLDKSKSSATGDIGTYQLVEVPGTRSVILDKVHAPQAREALETVPDGKKDEVLQMFARHWPSTTQASRAEVQALATELQVASKSTVNRAIGDFTKSGHLEYVNGGKNVRLTDKGRYYVEAVTEPLNP